MKVVVTCSVADGDAPFEVTWLRNGRALPEDSVRVQKYTDDFATLTIEKASPRHNGEYTCAAKNGVAEVNYTSTLTVHGEYFHARYQVLRNKCEKRLAGALASEFGVIARILLFELDETGWRLIVGQFLMVCV